MLQPDEVAAMVRLHGLAEQLHRRAMRGGEPAEV
jgi:hypothetical protein